MTRHPRALGPFALALALAGAASAQDPPTLERLVADLCGTRTKRRAPAAAQLLAHPDRAAVIAALFDVLTEPAEEPPMPTAVGIGVSDVFKTTRRFVRVAVPRRPARHPELILHELDLAFVEWPPQAIVAWLLGQLGESAEAALGGLIQMLDSAHVSVRDNATATLVKLSASAGLLATHTGKRAWALGQFPRGSIPTTTLVGWLESASEDRRALALHLCDRWQIASPQLCDLMLSRVERFDDRAALGCLESVAPTSVPQLLRLFGRVRGDASPTTSQRAIAALRGLDWSNVTLPRDAARSSLMAIIEKAANDQASVEKGGVDEAFLALQVLSEFPALDTDQRAVLESRVRAACVAPEPFWRKLGLRFLGQFARDANDVTLARERLSDPFDDVAWAAAVAVARLGGAIDDAVLLRLCQSDEVKLTRPYLRAHVRAHREASLAVFTAEAAQRPSELLDVLIAAASGDGTALVAMPKQRPYSADVRDLAADLLHDLEPLTAERIAQFTAGRRTVVGTHILVTATADRPFADRLPLLRKALELGAKRAAGERSWPTDHTVFESADALLHASLDALAAADAATTATLRKALEPLLKIDNYGIRRRAIDLLTR